MYPPDPGVTILRRGQPPPVTSPLSSAPSSSSPPPSVLVSKPDASFPSNAQSPRFMENSELPPLLPLPVNFGPRSASPSHGLHGHEGVLGNLSPLIPNSGDCNIFENDEIDRSALVVAGDTAPAAVHPENFLALPSGHRSRVTSRRTSVEGIGPSISAALPTGPALAKLVSDHNMAVRTQTSKPWVAVVDQNRRENRPITKRIEIVNGVGTASIPEVVLEKSKPMWGSYVIGYIIGNPPHIGTIHATVNRLWVSSIKGHRIDAHYISPKTVLFRIEDEVLRNRVIHRHFWHVSDGLMVVQE